MRTLVVVLLGLRAVFGQEAPKVVNPLPSAPQIATVNEPFSYSIPSGTFSPSSGLTYAALNLPAFLSFSPDTIVLSGTPSTSDLGTYSVRITASANGVVASDSLAISVRAASSNITTNIPLSSQLVAQTSSITSAFPYSASSPYWPGVRVPPGWSFSLGFQSQTFTSPSRIYYSASMDDGGPLLPWLSFNPYTVTFDGVTPTTTQNNTDIYRVRLGAGTSSGTMDIWDTFSIGVSAHSLEQTREMTVNLTAGYPIKGSVGNVVSSSFQLDRKRWNATSGGNITTDLSTLPWASFDTTNLTLSGTPPADLAGKTENVSMVVTDAYGDRVDTSMGLRFFPSVFTSDRIGPLRVLPGTLCIINLKEYLSNSTNNFNLTTLFTPSDAANWLAMDPVEKVFLGHVPSDVPYPAIDILIKAQDMDTRAWSKTHIGVLFAPASTSAVASLSHRGLSKAAIVGIIVAALLNILLIALFIACWIHPRRHKGRGENDETAEGFIHNDVNKDGGYDYTAVRGKTSMGTPVEHLAGGALFDRDAEDRRKSIAKESIYSDDKAQTFPISNIPILALTTDTPVSTLTGKTRQFLANPFASLGSAFVRTKERPKISNPILHPSFSNAAFQAQLAIAVDAAGIVSRGGTYESQESDYNTSGTVIESGTYTASGTGVGTTSISEYTANPSSSGWDRSATSNSNSATDVEGSRLVGVHKSGLDPGSQEGTLTDDSQFVRSSRASWESEPPFIWTSNGLPANRDSGASETTSESNNTRPTRNTTPSGEGSDMDHTVETGETGETGFSDEYSAAEYTTYTDYTYGTHPDSGTGSSMAVEDASQNRLNRHIQHASAISAYSTASAVPHSIVTPSTVEEDPSFSIDNIHFPTDSDLAATEGGTEGGTDPSEHEAVITTANRIDARKTLDSPDHASPASSHTERAPSPVRNIQSRLVSFGKPKVVSAEGIRSGSQTAVISDGSPVGSYRSGYTNGSNESTTPTAANPNPRRQSSPEALPRRTSDRKIRARAATGSSKSISSLAKVATIAAARSNASQLSQLSRRESHSPTPPSLPSLPALPTMPSVKSVSTVGSQKMGFTRVLLGVNEPFHFYPPLNLTPSSSFASHTDIETKPDVPAGKTYVAFLERKIKGHSTKMDPLPEWLHFDDMELWGSPEREDTGVWNVRILERGDGERTVGRFALEVCFSTVA